MTDESTRETPATACARTLAALQGVTLDDADAALCGHLLDAMPGTLTPLLEAARAARPDGTLFDVPPGAHAAVLNGKWLAGERA